MAVPVRVQKLIWGTFAGRCAMCRKRLVHDDAGGALSLVGEIAHIVGAKESAPRGRARCAGSRAGPENLLLLCRDHHKIIDDNERLYPPERLRRIRAGYLAWLDGQLAPAKFRTAVSERADTIACSV